MRGRNLTPARVHQTATAVLNANVFTNPPPWYTTIGRVPPSEILTRTQPPQHLPSSSTKKPHARVRKPSKLFKPQLVEYEEDALRKEFFRDHPWELARPRVVLEDGGRDGEGRDWRRLRQQGMGLSGENVVQRQLHLLATQPLLSKPQAYDIARKEFYALRHEEEIERRVQREEALWSGAMFGMGALEAGMVVEDLAFEKWKVYAQREADAAQTRAAAGQAVGMEGEDEEEQEGEGELGMKGEGEGDGEGLLV